jgi:hypothetical protein
LFGKWFLKPREKHWKKWKSSGRNKNQFQIFFKAATSKEERLFLFLNLNWARSFFLLNSSLFSISLALILVKMLRYVVPGNKEVNWRPFG